MGQANSWEFTMYYPILIPRQPVQEAGSFQKGEEAVLAFQAIKLLLMEPPIQKTRINASQHNMCGAVPVRPPFMSFYLYGC